MYYIVYDTQNLLLLVKKQKAAEVKWVLQNCTTLDYIVLFCCTADRSGGQLKGILKNGSAAADDSGDEELMCNVPEHHDLVSRVPGFKSL